MKKKLLLLALLGFMLTGCGSEPDEDFLGENGVESVAVEVAEVTTTESEWVELKIPESQQNVELKIPEETAKGTEEAVAESAEMVTADEPYYQIRVSGVDVSGTIDEIVEWIKHEDEVGRLKHFKDDVVFYLQMNDYVEDINTEPENIEECVRQFFMNAENNTTGETEAFETVEITESVTEPAITVEQIIEDNMYELEGYFDNGFNVVFYGVDTTDTDRRDEVAALALSDGTTMYLYRVGSGFYNRIDCVDLDTLNTTDSYVTESKIHVWAEYEE